MRNRYFIISEKTVETSLTDEPRLDKLDFLIETLTVDRYQSIRFLDD
jgi:hypothetical protein